MIHGEAVVLRILDRGDAMLGLEHLGMAARDRDDFDKVLDMPHGIMLVTGPTGSGKTTTLYAALSKINDTDLKIITIEDPVEYQLHGINQIQVNTKIGLTFAAGLRAILRQDPDVVLIGEIRDQETAEIAVQASLTGHLVFSTLHTNDAPGAATRLIDMGIEPYLVASSLEMVVAQRLVRLICKHCKEPRCRSGSRQAAATSSATGARRALPRPGCRDCQGTGYRGRQGVFEMMPVTDEIRALILERAPSHEHPQGRGQAGHAKPARRRLAPDPRGPHDGRRGHAEHEGRRSRRRFNSTRCTGGREADAPAALRRGRHLRHGRFRLHSV